MKRGRVSSVSFAGIGHLIPMEIVDKTAEAVAGWVAPEIERWRMMEDQEQRVWKSIPKKERAMLSEEYITVMKSNWMEEAAAEMQKVSKL